jgi:CBS domain-containing membrane protein
MTRPRLRAVLRHLGPAMGFPGWYEIARATLAIVVALVLVELLLPPVVATPDGLFLIAPFGATAIMLIALPNSPLAQPWTVFCGNTVSAAIAVTVVLSVGDPALRLVLATGLALAAMLALRALHPPGGAVAAWAALTPDVIETLGYRYVIEPVALGSVALVLLALPIARLTGRRYPFRQPPETAGPPVLPEVSPQDLAELLMAYRQSANIGVEDLARLIAAAERLSEEHMGSKLRPPVPPSVPPSAPPPPAAR